MCTTSKYVLALAIVVGGLFALSLAMKTLPDGELWFITAVSSVFVYRACTKLGLLALVESIAQYTVRHSMTATGRWLPCKSGIRQTPAMFVCYGV